MNRSSGRGNTTEEREWIVYRSLAVLNYKVRSVLFSNCRGQKCANTYPNNPKIHQAWDCYSI